VQDVNAISAVVDNYFMLIGCSDKYSTTQVARNETPFYSGYFVTGASNAFGIYWFRIVNNYGPVKSMGTRILL